MSPHPSSSSNGSSDSSAYPWILEHILAYPGTYEIPLRTMYTLNSTPPTKQLHQQPLRPDTPSLSSTASSPDSSPQSPDFPPDQQQHVAAASATEHFKSCLMTHISQLPSQPFSLPPSFITSFVRRCFTADLCLVDFTQALTAMDYLKDLDNRRKRELSQALQRLGLDRTSADASNADGGNDLNISEWVNSMQDKERKVEALYTQVYIGLRRWTLINEMRLEPFSKPNSIAMLNTLYPPTTVAPPTRQLTSHILSSQRNAFFRYITGVEQNGKEILKNLEHQGQRPGDMNGWPVVREIVDKYLRTANGVIEECLEVTGPTSFTAESAAFRRNERRADSGVSFATNDRPSTSSSSASKKEAPIVNKPLPISPAHAQQPQPSSSTSSSQLPPPSLTPRKRGTTFEKIAREFRNLRYRHDVKEIAYNRTNTDPDCKEPKLRGGLRKMKSTSSIANARRDHSRSGSDEPMPDFDLDARRRRLIEEARREKEKKSSGNDTVRNASVSDRDRRDINVIEAS